MRMREIALIGRISFLIIEIISLNTEERDCFISVIYEYLNANLKSYKREMERSYLYAI